MGAALAAPLVGPTMQRSVACAAVAGGVPALVAALQVARTPSDAVPTAADELFTAKVRRALSQSGAAAL